MTSAEFTQELPATPEQASYLLTEVVTLTTLQVEPDHYPALSIDLQEIPSAVAKHLPEAEALPGEISDSAYVQQIVDLRTGQPRPYGVVGMVTFTRAWLYANRSYQASANYHIRTEDGGVTYGLEQHLDYRAEGDPHEVFETSELPGRTRVRFAGWLDELITLTDDLEASRSVEAAIGLLMVSQTEAQQVIDFVRSLNAVR